MFTTEQLKQLSNFLINEFKEVFATKADFKVLDDKISTLQNSVDGLAKLGSDNQDEVAALGGRVDNVKGWVKVAAPKLGLEYKT